MCHKTPTLFCTLWKDVSFADTKIDVSFEKVNNGVIAVLKTNNYARCVNLIIPEKNDVVFSDNYFDIMPGCEKKIYIRGEDINVDNIIVRSWQDIWEY